MAKEGRQSEPDGVPPRPPDEPVMSLEEFGRTDQVNGVLLAGFRQHCQSSMTARRRPLHDWRRALQDWAARPTT